MIIFFLIIATIAVFLGAAALLVIGIVKKNTGLIAGGIVALLVFLAGVAYTAFTFVSKTLPAMQKVFHVRTGNEIYKSVFGAPDFECVEVVHSQDNNMPNIANGIRLHAYVCPEELKRILISGDFESDTLDPEEVINSLQTPGHQWFHPEYLGDTVIVYRTLKGFSGESQKIFSNADSNEIYCVDYAGF